ncbi:granzyme A-like [Hemicordylus capensis]|uniref:granzyme A-like n=1 Tax=Hemicordylus capensis TaxID=884348 RepID=UPI0023027313|nr:granzyme A-like [Hemicordylus capensis]
MDTGHTSDELAAIMDRQVEGWLAGEPNLCQGFMVTDNTANITKAARQVYGVNIACAVHNLNLVVKDALGLKQTSKAKPEPQRLNKNAKITKTVKTIQLPSTKTSSDVQAGTQCLVAGWGATGNGETSDTLREVNVTIFDRSFCNDKNHYNKPNYVTKNMLCAGDENGEKDSARGDSGGPLMCDGEQRGIVSFGGPKCGDSKYPGIYTQLTKDYINWIKTITGGDTD